MHCGLQVCRELRRGYDFGFRQHLSTLSDTALHEFYGRWGVYGSSKWQLNKKEIRRLGWDANRRSGVLACRRMKILHAAKRVLLDPLGRDRDFFAEFGEHGGHFREGVAVGGVFDFSG